SLQSQFSQPESTTIHFEDSINELTTSLEKQKNDIISLSEKIEKLENLELVNLFRLSSSTESAVMGDNLLVLGTSTLREATVIEALAVGTTLHITPSSINTLEELSIQPFKQGAIDLMAGAVRIETDGTVTFAENVEFAKDIAVKGAITTS